MAATITWLLEHSPSGEKRLLAGAAGTGNRIDSVNIMDNPDTVQWLKPNELILTTGYLFLDDAQLRNRIVAELAGRGCAGMGFVLGRYFDAPPPEIIRQADALGFPVFSIPYEASLAEIGWHIYQHNFEEGMSQTERLAALQRRLGEDMLREKGVGGMIQDIVAATGHPVLLLDEELVLISSDDAGTTGFHELFSAAAGTPAFSRHITRSIAEAARKQRPDHIVQTIPHNGGVVRLGVFPLYDEGGVLGYLCLAETPDELTPANHQFIKGVKPLLAIQLLRRTHLTRTRTATRQEFMRFLLSPNRPTTADVKTQCDLYGFDYRPRRVCILFRLGEHANRTAKQRKGVSDTAFSVAEETFGTSHAHRFSMPFQDNLAVFVFLPDDAGADDVFAAVDRDAKIVTDRLTGMGIPAVAGISKWYAGADTVRLSLDQAFEAVRLGRELDPGATVHHFRRHQFAHILAGALTSRQARELHGETIGCLEKDDRESGHNLAAVLTAFINNRHNISDAAAELSLHRNTVAARLERIEEILGRDPRDLGFSAELVAGMMAGKLLAAGLLARDEE